MKEDDGAICTVLGLYGGSEGMERIMKEKKKILYQVGRKEQEPTLKHKHTGKSAQTQTNTNTSANKHSHIQPVNVYTLKINSR